MSTYIKHVFKFQEQRRTVFLAASNKDNLGRHRGAVQYGMKLTPSGTTVQIGPGALYTAFGTRLYLDIESPTIAGLMTLDLNDTSVVNINNQSIFNSSQFARRPIIVAIIAKFDVYGVTDPSDLPQAKQVESESDVSTEVSFQARLVSWDRISVNPAFHIIAQNPVFMNQGAQSDAQSALNYGTKSNYSLDSVIPSPLGNDYGSIKFDEIVIGYIIIGATLETQTGPSNAVFPTTLEQTPSTGIWANGVDCVQCQNSWEALEDFIGADVLFGRSDRMTVSSPIGFSALSQGSGAWNVGPAGTTTGPLTLAPKFGSQSVVSGAYTTYSNNYRLPSFMRDGDPLLSVMQRLDYYLRLWMNRTGDQGLVGQIQDGKETGQTFMSPLLNMLRNFDGSSAPGTNKNSLRFRDGGLSASLVTSFGVQTDPNNRVLKSGLIPHNDVQATDINSILAGTYGDTHYGALRAIDVCLGNILDNVFGASIPRSLLRTTASWPFTSLFTDFPINLTTYPTGVTAGTLPYLNTASPYLKMVGAINQLAYRSERTSGQNLLLNGGFWSPVLLNWSFTSGFVYTQNAVANGISNLAITEWPNRAVLSQTLSSESSLGSAIYNTAGLISASIIVQNDVQLTMFIYNNGSQLAKIVIPQSPSPRTVSMSLDLTGITLAAGTFKFAIENTDSNDGSEVFIYGASLNAGMPNPCPASATSYDFLSRDGGVTAPMRGNFVTGTNDIYFGSALTDNVWLPLSTSTITSGPIESQYLSNQPAKTALNILNARTTAGVGPNWCHNPNGTEAPATTGSQLNSMPPYWSSHGTVWNWAANVAPQVSGTFPGKGGHYTTFISNDYIQNYIQLPTTPTFLVNDLTAAGGLLSASALVTNNHVTNSIQLQVLQVKLSDGTARFVMASNVISPLRTGVMSVTAKVDSPDDFTHGYLMVRLISVGATNDVNVSVFGVCANAGMPQQSPGWDSARSDYLPLAAGPSFPMTGTIDMGTNSIIDTTVPTTSPVLSAPILDAHAPDVVATKAYVDEAIRRYCPANNLGQINIVVKQDSTMVIRGSGSTADDCIDIPGMSIRLDNSHTPFGPNPSWWVIEAFIYYTFKIKTELYIVLDTGSTYDVSTTLGNQWNGALGPVYGPRAFRAGISLMPGEQPFAPQTPWPFGVPDDSGDGADNTNALGFKLRGPHLINPGGANGTATFPPSTDSLLAVLVGDTTNGLIEGVNDTNPKGSHGQGYMDPLLGSNALSQSNWLSKSSVVTYRSTLRLTGAATLKFRAGPHVSQNSTKRSLVHVGSYIKAYQVLNRTDYATPYPNGGLAFTNINRWPGS